MPASHNRPWITERDWKWKLTISLSGTKESPFSSSVVAPLREQFNKSFNLPVLFGAIIVPPQTNAWWTFKSAKKQIQKEKWKTSSWAGGDVLMEFFPQIWKHVAFSREERQFTHEIIFYSLLLDSGPFMPVKSDDFRHGKLLPEQRPSIKWTSQRIFNQQTLTIDY